MSPSARLMQYLQEIEKRLRWRETWRGAALISWCALVVTVLLVLLADRYAFSEGVLFWCRIALFLSIGAAATFGLLLPLLRLNRNRVTHEVERAFPTFEERLLTVTETPDSNPFKELLAEEVLAHSEEATPDRLAPGNRLAAFGALAAGAAGVLIWLIAAGPGFLGYGAARLWAGPPKQATPPLYALDVKPGNVRVRKGSDQLIEVRTSGYEAQQVKLLAKQSGSAQWETLPMERMPGAAGHTFLFAGLSSSVDYRVEAGKLRSETFSIRVVDLPGVKRIRVSYQFPSWTALPVAVEDPGGDLRAVEGTQATLEVETDRPLNQAMLIVDDGQRIELKPVAPNRLQGVLTVKRDGMYHVATLDQNEPVRISEDYFIEARKEKAPDVKIARPGRDSKVSPIEEVAIEITANDDFAVQALELRYSVNGGEEKAVPLLKQKGQPAAIGSTLLALEDYKLSPGDIVAMYALARDARNTTRSDVMFLEAQPYEREIRQSQTAGGGGGGMGGEDDDREGISKRQKEIIAATWNQIRGQAAPQQSRENAEFLAGVQKKLSEQTRSLAKRMNSRQLSGQNEQFQQFSKEMDQAARAMDEATDRLKQQGWNNALSPEQRALQHILRAEALFREIQVAFGQRGGGGGGGQGGRDLESLFDLELDTEKNQYETAQQQSQGGGADPRAQQVDEALRRLEDLARRQQQLAEQQRRESKQSFEQRWAQEMLRRDAEELRRQMEQLSRGQQQSGQQQSGQQQSGQQSAQSGQQSQSSGSQGGAQSQSQQAAQSQSKQGNAGSRQQPQQQQQRMQQMAGTGSQQQYQSERIERALRDIERAMDDMRKAASPQSAGGDPAGARRAAERMAEARDALGRMRSQQSGQTLEGLASQAEELAQQQREFEKKLNQAFPSANGRPAPGQQQAGREVSEKLADEKAQMEQDYRKLEESMREALRGLGGQRQAASRMREALGEAQQNELGLRLKYGADNLRRGYGAYLAPREKVVTQGLEQLSEKVKQAQAAAASGDRGKEEQAERALQGLEQLRAALDRQAQQGRSGQQGQQAGQQGQQGGQQGQQGGQQGQQGGQEGQQGGQQGQQGQGGQQGQSGQQGQGGQQSGQGMGQGRGEYPMRGSRGQSFGRDYSAMNDGTLRGPEGSGARDVERAYGDVMRELNRLQQGADSSETREEASRLVRRMQQLDPSRFPGNPALLEQLRTQIVPGLQDLELMLRRDLDKNQEGQVRSGSGARVPPKYADAVAEYYRRLSKGK